MPQPHRIRLRRPWRYESDGAVHRWRRVFHEPTGLDAAHQVWLVIQSLPSPSTITLNGERLGQRESSDTQRFNITTSVRLNNELAIEVTEPTFEVPRDAPPCEVTLEIVEAAGSH